MCEAEVEKPTSTPRTCPKLVPPKDGGGKGVTTMAPKPGGHRARAILEYGQAQSGAGLVLIGFILFCILMACIYAFVTKPG